MAAVPGTFLYTLNAEAATNLSADANLHQGVDIDASGDGVAAGDAATGQDFAGFLEDGGRGAGHPITVSVLGVGVARAGEALNEGDYCATAADAEVVQIAGANEWSVFQTFQAAADQDLPWGLIIRAQSVDGKP